MDKEKQRIAIAQACGLTPPFIIKNEGKWRAKKEIWTVPDYLNDLNAMHEAEKTLNHEDRVLYVGHMYEIFEREGSGIEFCDNPQVAATVIHATAAQRAESFLRTIGKWNETP